ncbi:hypothetical protein KI387_013593 [Taxus chinensis]|uniref:Armadillo repeat-containing protein 8 n=1 Tax=Taxus chinensis TaxID=29808 RepID=A0AA38CK09_TAXCH|nr:hypothetical protein KI387_013593 [Taxus chinensis]
MPSSSSVALNRPEELVEQLSSIDGNAKLRALRDVKNQIIGNKTKKNNYIKLGAIPKVVEILANETDAALLVESAVSVGSFARDVDAGVKALLENGVLPHLVRILRNSDNKVVEACARSLRIIIQSKLAPKYDMLEDNSIELLRSLLTSQNENVLEVAASIIARCCETNEEQQAVIDVGALERLVCLLGNSMNRREASLDALVALVKNNSQITLMLIGLDNGGALATIIKLLKYKSPRTRLLSCMCLSNIIHASPSSYPQEKELKVEMLSILVKLLDEPGQVGEATPYALADLVANSEEMQKLAFDEKAIEKLCSFLCKGFLQDKHLQGILVALAELCSRLEESRRQVLDLQAQSPITTAFEHKSIGVRVAACSCIKSISRSVKVHDTESAGFKLILWHYYALISHLIFFVDQNLRTILTSETSENLVSPLFKLLDDETPEVQVAALGAISNIVLDFIPHKKVFFKCGGVGQLIQLARSMDPMLRLNAMWALRNLMYLADMAVKQKVMMELTTSTLTSLIHDHEEFIQEQALAFVRNLVYGSVESVQLVFAENGRIFNSVVSLLEIATRPEICTQGIYVLSNVAAGNEYHKEQVMRSLTQNIDGECMPSTWIRFLQDFSNPHVRIAAVWCIMNLSYPDSPGLEMRIARLSDAGVLAQIQKMTDDQCLDVKDRVKTVLEQVTSIGKSL